MSRPLILTIAVSVGGLLSWFFAKHLADELIGSEVGVAIVKVVLLGMVLLLEVVAIYLFFREVRGATEEDDHCKGCNCISTTE